MEAIASVTKWQGRAMTPAALLASCRMDTASLTARGAQLLLAAPLPAGRR